MPSRAVLAPAKALLILMRVATASSRVRGQTPAPTAVPATPAPTPLPTPAPPTPEPTPLPTPVPTPSPYATDPITYELRACVSGRGVIKLQKSSPSTAFVLRSYLEWGERIGGPLFCGEWNDTVQIRVAPTDGELETDAWANHTMANHTSWTNVSLAWPAGTKAYCPRIWPNGETRGCRGNWSHSAHVSQDDFPFDFDRCAYKWSGAVDLGRAGYSYNNGYIDSPWRWWNGNGFQFGLDDRGKWGNLTNESAVMTMRFTCGGSRLTGQSCTHYSSRCRSASYDHRESCVCDQCDAGWNGTDCQDFTSAYTELPLTDTYTFEVEVCSNALADFHFHDNGVRVWHHWGEVPGGPTYCQGHPGLRFRNVNTEDSFTNYTLHWPRWPTVAPYNNKTCNADSGNDHWCGNQWPNTNETNSSSGARVGGTTCAAITSPRPAATSTLRKAT